MKDDQARAIGQLLGKLFGVLVAAGVAYGLLLLALYLIAR